MAHGKVNQLTGQLVAVGRMVRKEMAIDGQMVQDIHWPRHRQHTHIDIHTPSSMLGDIEHCL